MSPRIGMAVDLEPFVPESAEPIDRVMAAIRIARAQGFEVAKDGDCARVGRDAITGGWTVGRRTRALGRLTLAGAICLALQPLEGTTEEGGAAWELGVDRIWLLGVIRGWESGSAVDPAGELAAGPARALYRSGLLAGADALK